MLETWKMGHNHNANNYAIHFIAMQWSADHPYDFCGVMEFGNDLGTRTRILSQASQSSTQCTTCENIVRSIARRQCPCASWTLHLVAGRPPSWTIWPPHKRGIPWGGGVTKALQASAGRGIWRRIIVSVFNYSRIVIKDWMQSYYNIKVNKVLCICICRNNEVRA